jgi:hypothetical protein
MAASAFGIVFGAPAQGLPLLLRHVILLAVNPQGLPKRRVRLA